MAQRLEVICKELLRIVSSGALISAITSNLTTPFIEFVSATNLQGHSILDEVRWDSESERFVGAPDLEILKELIENAADPEKLLELERARKRPVAPLS